MSLSLIAQVYTDDDSDGELENEIGCRESAGHNRTSGDDLSHLHEKENVPETAKDVVTKKRKKRNLDKVLHSTSPTKHNVPISKQQQKKGFGISIRKKIKRAVFEEDIKSDDGASMDQRVPSSPCKIPRSPKFKMDLDDEMKVVSQVGVATDITLCKEASPPKNYENTDGSSKETSRFKVTRAYTKRRQRGRRCKKNIGNLKKAKSQKVKPSPEKIAQPVREASRSPALTLMSDEEKVDLKANLKIELCPQIKKAFRCPHCFSPFDNAELLIEHLPIHIKTEATETKIEENVRPVVKSPVEKFKRSPKETRIKKPLEVGNTQKTIKKSYQCEHCSFSCPHLPAFLNHVKVHDKTGKPFKCAKCPFYYRTIMGLTKHVNSHHTQTKKKAEASMEDLDPDFYPETDSDSEEDSTLEWANLTPMPCWDMEEALARYKIKSFTINLSRCDDQLQKFGLLANSTLNPARTTEETPVRAKDQRGNKARCSSQEKTFNCKKCSMTFPYESELSCHVVMVHFKIPRKRQKFLRR